MTDTLPAGLRRRVRPLCDRFSGALGLWAHNLKTGEQVELAGDERFPSASTIKLWVLRELFRRSSEGALDLDRDFVEMGPSDRVIGSGVMKDLTPGFRASLRDAATLMITVSDNTATNLLVARLGVGDINRAARRAGYGGTHLHGLLFKGRGIRGSYTTPAESGRFMLGVARGTEVSRAASAEMLGILRREQYANIVGRLIPFDPYASGRDRWRLASKSGSIRGVRNDAAIVEGPECRYVVALMSRDCSDERFNVDNEANLVLARVAAEIHRWFTRG
jgi:beta-lactamase class A